MLDGKVCDIKNAVYSKSISQTYITDRPYKLLGNHHEVLFYQNPVSNLFWLVGWTKRQFSDLGYWTVCPILRKKRQGLRKETKNSESLLLHLQVLLLYSYIFPDSKNTQTYKRIIVIITYFLFIGKWLVVVRVICSCFQYKTSLAI